MTTISVDVLNPKATKLLKELEHLGLIKLNPSDKAPKQDFYISERMLDILDKEYADYMNGIGKNYTREEVMSKYKK
jgi:hypothetical protein